jgi:putative DNA primase/helicase
MPLEAADGSWPRLLMELGGLSPEQLTDTHQPCPNCGGEDRYRWDQDDGPGGWFCNQCGGKDRMGGGGNGMDLLMRVKGWEFKDACRRVEEHLGLPQPKATKPKGRPHRIPDQPPPDAAPPALGRATAQWCYRNAAGEQLFWVQRIPTDTGKLFVHRTWLDGGWHYPSKRDPFKSEWPTPRPLYRLPDLTDRPDAPVLITEGEKTADAAAQLFPDHVCLAWCGGTGGVNSVDWQALAGRDVTLWPDADNPGRECMRKLAAKLLPIAASVAIVAPPKSAPEAWDLADATDWTQRQAINALRKFAKPVEGRPQSEPEPKPPAPAAPPQPPTRDIPKSGPFTCLGFDSGVYYYLPRSTGQVTKITRGSHTATNLLELAEIPYWESVHPSKEGVNWLAAASNLFRTQAAAGVFDPDRIRGRGAWLDNGRVVFHLGDRLIVDRAPYSVHSPPPTRFFYEQARHLDGPSEQPMDDETALQLRIIAERFKWEMPVSANFLLGWLVLAPVCGALNWRPHIWVTGGAGTGKTTVLKTFMRPLMGGVLQSATGGTTEAGLRGTLKSDAIPVVFDEFEQNEAKDKQIVQNVLALARIASSEGGKIYKGTPGGGTNAFEIRSMFCVSSINVSLIQKADIDRFCVLGLRKGHFDENEWLDFERKILSVSTVENGRALIARTLNNLPTIVKNAKVLAHALGRKFGQRFGDQHGTLLAGAWSLESGGGCELDLQQAQQWIDQMDWNHQQADDSDADEIKCRDTMLQQIVRFGGGLDASLGEMVKAVAKQQSLGRTVYDELVPILGRYGMKVFRIGDKLPDGEKSECCQLAIANNNAQLHQLLKATPWSNGAHRSALRRITGAVAPSSPTHFAGVGSKRCTLVPLSDADLAIS